jgi:serine phosphatase RsbU (regulator of sigma subunit)
LRNQKIIGAILFLLTLGAVTPYMALMRPWAAVFLASAGLAGTLLVTFFKFDLQAAFISVGIYPLVISIGHFLVQPSPPLRQAGIVSTIIVLGVTAIAAFFFFKGRWYTEDQVRPLYARNLAERLSMQAEVSAAREAQIRLLPQTLPTRPTLTIAAACLPAHEVGGDFYDVFELDENRLALFMAEGDGRGLASALSIAFAKGYLMPKIKGTGRADDSPSEIVRSLQKRLLTTMAGEGTPGFIYAVLDTSEGTLRYARTGNAPSLVVSRARRDGSLQRPAEHEIQFPLDHANQETISVLAGSCDVGAGDALLLLTDGMLKVWRGHDQPATAAFWKTLLSHHAPSGHQLRDALDHTMKASHKQAERKGVVDDLTVVVVRIEKSFESASDKEATSDVQKILKEAVEQA